MTNSHSGGPVYRYDARGRLISSKKNTNPIISFLFGFLLPYVVINGIILMLVISSPSLEVSEPDSTNYNTASVQVRVESLLPLKSLTAVMGGQEVPLEKSGDTYKAVVEENGVLEITAVSMNKMTRVEHVQINLLDETAPVVDESSVNIGVGYLEFLVSDTQSGVDYDSIFGTDGQGNELKPTEINKANGKITFSMATNSLIVFVKDLSGNETSATFSIN